MADRLYRPRTLMLLIKNTRQLRNIDLDSVSNDTIFMTKDRREKISISITTNSDNNRIFIQPLSLYEEGSEYSVIFSKKLKYTDGVTPEKNYGFSFSIIGATLVMKNVIDNNFVKHLPSEAKSAPKSDYKYVHQHIKYVRSVTDRDELNEDSDMESTESDDEEQPSRDKKKWRIAGIISLALILLLMSALMIRNKLTEEPQSENPLLYNLSETELDAILQNGSSNQYPPGAILSGSDVSVNSKDINIIHNSARGIVTFTLWDFAAEDGDTVQIYFDGESITDEIILYNRPYIIKTPSTGVVEIRGIYDGGGGITYAVYCDANATMYLNEAPFGGSNKYILSRISAE